MDHEIGDLIADARNSCSKSVAAWRRYSNLRHYDRMVEKHGEENVAICECCHRGVLKSKSHELGGFHLGPTCWRRHKQFITKEA